MRCGISNLVLRAARASRTQRGVRLFHTRFLSPSKTPRQASCHQQVVNSVTPLLSRWFALSSPRHGADTVIRVPTMAESITEGTLAQFRKQIGDVIEQDE